MNIRSNIYKLLFVFSLTLVFMISSCSEPSEDKALPVKQTTETKQVQKSNLPEKPEPAKEVSEPEVAKPEAPKEKPKPATPEPEAPKPVAPPPKPANESSFIDVITMDNPAYSTHKKGIMLFTHKKHAEEYKIGCGECHHDKNGAPLNDLKKNDNVENCIACHTKPGQAPRPKDKTKLSLKEKLEYHAEAIHENCIKCHKEYNKKNDTKAAPSSCSKCHPKRS